MKLMDTLVEQALARSKRLRNMKKFINDVSHELATVMQDVSFISRVLQELVVMVDKHEQFMEQMLENQQQIFKEVSGSSIDTSLPTISSNDSKDKPN